MVNSVDLLFITETWFHSSIDSKCLSFFGQFEVLCRTDRKSEWQVQTIPALKELYIINNEFPDKNAIAEKFNLLGWTQDMLEKYTFCSESKIRCDCQRSISF